MWTMIIGLLNTVLGGFLGKYLDYLNEKDRLVTERYGLELAERAEAKTAAAKVLIAETNHWFAWVVRPLFGIPTGIYYATIVADSIFLFDWQVAALPPPYDEWGYTIMISYMLVEGGLGVSRILGNRLGT